MHHNPILITSHLTSRNDLYRAIADASAAPGAPTPPNLDAMADAIRESGITRVICADWKLSAEDTSRVLEVFDDWGVTLSR